MRLAMLAFVISIAASVVGCGSDEPPAPPACSPGVDFVNNVRCTPGVDTTCRFRDSYDCTCLCTGYWECDLVLVRCDAGIPDLAVRDLAPTGD